MRAYVLDRHGPPSVLRLSDRPDPVPGPGQVRIAVEAIGLNYAEILSRKGLYGWAPKLPYVPGMEVAGVIDGVGPGVDRRVGEPVVAGMQHGAYATHVVVDSASALPSIEGFSLEENAAFPVNFLTAWVGLVASGRMRAGDRVLISPAGGGVGTAAVQIAHRYGCDVIAAAGSDEKLERVRALGADATVNYRRPGWQDRLRDAAGNASVDADGNAAGKASMDADGTAAGGADGTTSGNAGVDIALEMVGGEVFRAAKSVLAPFGRVVVIGYASLDYRWWNPASLWRAWRGKPGMGLEEMLMRSIGISSSHVGYLLPHADRVRSLWDDLVSFVRSHGIRPQVGHVLPFQDMAEAHRLIESRESYGKVVVRL